MFIAEHLKKVKPYTVGLSESQEDFKKKHSISRLCHLASNENPLGPSPKVLLALQQKLGTLDSSSSTSLARYPNSQDTLLLKALSEHWQIPSSSHSSW